MELEKNELGGLSVILTEGDRLSKVPRSHQRLITPALREAFADPVACFRRLTKNCPFKQMGEWFSVMVDAACWGLELHRSPYGAATGFRWHSDEATSAMIALPLGQSSKSKAYPAALRRFYRMVNGVDWGGFGCGGSLDSVTTQLALSSIPLELEGADFDPDRTYLWGSSAAGDSLIWCADDRAGWLGNENGSVHLIGTIAETIDWIFEKLLQGDVPECDL